MKRKITSLTTAIIVLCVMLISLPEKGWGQNRTITPLLYESFDGCDGAGGNDDQWSGSLSQTAISSSNYSTYFDNSGWTYSTSYAADECLRVGKTSDGPYTITTPSIAFTGNATLTFKAGAWNASGDGTALNLSSTNCTLKQNGTTITSVTMVKGSWTEYTVDITNATSPFTISFTTASKKSRFFIDEVTIYPKHTITYEVSPVSTGSISGENANSVAVNSGDLVTDGTTVTLTAATGVAGYTFDHWGFSGTDASLTSTSTNPTTFTMGSENATVTAYFVQNATTYATTIPAQTTGTITATPSSCTSGTSVKLHPTPSANYRFDGFTITKTEGGDDAGISPTGPDASGDYTFSMPAYNITVNGTFTRVYNVNFTVGDGATFVGNSAFTSTSNVKAAGTYTLPSATKTNYALEGWYDESTVYAKGASYTVSGDVTFTAQWIPTTTHTFDFTSVNNFYTATTGDTHPTEGTKITEFYYGQDRIKFTADGTDNCKFSSYQTSYYFIFGKQNGYINLPSFEGYKIIQVVLHSSSGCSQSVGVKIVSGSNDVASSQTWSSTDTDYTYDIPVAYQKSDLTVKIATNHNAQITSISIVCVELPSYVLTIDSPSNGTFTVKDKNNNAISNGANVKEGALVKLAATPDDGYVLEAFSVTKASSGSVEVTTNGNNGTFNMPDDAVTVNATFAAKKTLTYKANDGTGEDVVEDYASGTNVELKDGSTIFTAPSPQHYFLYWTKNADGTGTQYEAGDEYELTDNTTLYANWSNLYNVAVSSVENVTISASYDAKSTIAEGENADVAYGTTITLNHNLDADKTFIWDVYKTSDFETKVTVENNLFTVPAYGVTVSGEIKDVYTITFDVNGDTEAIAAVNVVEGNSIDLTANAYKPSLAGYTFKGWSETNGSATTIATPKTYTPAASKTLYAVFTKVTGSDNFTLDKDSGFPSTYNSSGETLTLAGHSFYVKDVGTSYNNNIQIKNGSGVIYNSSSFGKITEIKLEGTYTNTVIYYGNSSNPSSETISPGTGANAGKYDLSEIKPEYIKITSSGGASNLTSIKITFEDSSDVVFVNSACTKAGIAVGEIVNVGANGILTLTGSNAGNASNLIIEDGGQIIVSSSTVKATFNKTIEAPAKKTDVYGWYTISSPVHDDDVTTIDVDNVTNLVSNSDPLFKYDMFAYDEYSHNWLNQKESTVPGQLSDGFENMEKGMGYIYRNSDEDISFAGIVNYGDYTIDGLTYTSGTLAGFHLLGNPYSHNIKLTNTTLLDENGYPLASQLSGCYILRDDSWGAEITTEDIAPNQGFLVKISSDAKKIKFSETKRGVNYHNDNIKFTVANNQHEDAAYALFKNAIGLDKINHRSPEVPMLYINQNGEDLAIAPMSDDTKAFNLNFKAGVMGKYTLSYNADGNFDYIHIYDRITNTEVDMLLEGEYSFSATPNDPENRFIVKLGYMPDYSEGNDDIFAYQSGSNILISGQGELQIFDVTGRSVMTTTINGAESISIYAQGVYIFKLNEKVQKIVVR